MYCLKMSTLSCEYEAAMRIMDNSPQHPSEEIVDIGMRVIEARKANDKPVMQIHSVLSSDGKVMTATRKVMGGPVKPGTYTDVWEKQ